MARTQQEIYDIQKYIFKKLSSTMYDYTTLSQPDRLTAILELLLNWIAFEMENKSEKRGT